MGRNVDLGRTGESMAVDFLKSLGYTIMVKNYSSRYGEIDIIAQDEDTLVFVEVKTRKKRNIYPREYVDIKKQKKIIITAEKYLAQRAVDMPCRFDVIEIIIDGSADITHIKDAFSL